ncbi:serine/threonine protein kinase [Vitiosangium sp. GDMCC 1.1324]|uniref:serine/threonine protein kinase n=1 Tax=Vitiosangium sp. (strain GDMCC 1.1324) TaxID=2138576 RepID=UPI00130E9CB6|nr:serine/threonine protein kinase [Vitiosangium sp. GDMCC 1.1324]
MNESGAGGPMEEREWQRVARPPFRESPEEHLPQVGMEVAGYRLERRLGKGGQGTVFRARREGRLFAVKLIYLRDGAHWAWRELDVMVKLWRAGGLPLEGHGLWPARRPRFLFLVTPFVRGLPLDMWTRVMNPTARKIAELMLQAARLLQAVHAAGVIHRDVKGANLLVYGEDRLVLVDFGVATYEGAPTVTGPFPPGTWPYLSPRVWRAWRGEEESSDCPGDDVWALGVELYRMLTGRLPFQGREGALVQAILHQEPEAPHTCNPQVPRGLGEVCQRMLCKQPGEGYADARALEVALEEALRQADAAWDEPLFEAWSPQHATTLRQADLYLAGEALEALYERLASYERRPVRGKPLPPDELPTLTSPGEEPPGPEAPQEAPPACAEAPKEAMPPVAPEVVPGADEARVDALPLAPAVESSRPPAPGVDEAPSASVAAPVATAKPPPPVSLPEVPAARSRWVPWATGVLLVLGLCVGLAVSLVPRGSERPISPEGTPQTTLPPEFYPVTLEPGGQEVAPPWKRPEGDGGAAPEAAPTPAPVARATPPEDTRVKTPPKASTPQQSKPQPKESRSSAGTAGAIAITCTLATGCPSPTATQVRPTPQPAAPCPEGALQAMKELGLLKRRDRTGFVYFPGIEDTRQNVTVRSGPGAKLVLRTTTWGMLPQGTVLSGELFVERERVYGRFTQAHTPEGHTYPVCLELYDSTRDDQWGVRREPGGTADTANIAGGTKLESVEEFQPVGERE